ncbi:MAG: GumC family protein [Myxococcota bacterium]
MSAPGLQDETQMSPFLYQILAVVQNPFGLLRRRWIWMLLGLAVSLSVTFALYSTRVPTYQASATVIVSGQQIPEEFVRSTVSGLDSIAEINSLLGEAFSQKFLIGLIEEFNLYPEVLAAVDPSAAALIMRESIMVEPQDNIASNRRQRGEPSVIIGISYVALDPQVAARVTNLLAGNVIDASIERRSAQARGTTAFLQRELRDAQTELKAVDVELADFRKLHAGEMPEDLETLLRKLERLESQRNSLRVQSSSIQEQLTQIENAEGVQTSPATVLADLRIQLAQQLALHTDQHPNVLALRRQIGAIEDEMGELNRLLSQADAGSEHLAASARRELVTLQVSLEETGQEIDEVEDRVARIPGVGDELRRLEQRALVLRENYLEFLRKVQDAELAETLESAQQGPKVSILDAALPPGAPMNPPGRYLILGLLASVLVAVGLGVLLELLDPVVINRAQLESLQGPPVIGSVGKLG